MRVVPGLAGRWRPLIPRHSAKGRPLTKFLSVLRKNNWDRIRENNGIQAGSSLPGLALSYMGERRWNPTGAITGRFVLKTSRAKYQPGALWPIGVPACSSG